MLALPHEYIGSACEIKSMTNDLLAVGRVIKIDNEALELASGSGERMPLLQFRTPVKMFVYNERHHTRILEGVAYLSTENFARIEEVRPLQTSERRGAFRVNTNVSAHLVAALTREERETMEQTLLTAAPDEAERIRARQAFDVQVRDISLTGMRVQSGIVLPLSARFNTDFQLLDTPMSLCLLVRRLIGMPSGEIQYGCIFFDYSERQKDTLCKELFQLQRVEKSRRRSPYL